MKKSIVPGHVRVQELNVFKKLASFEKKLEVLEPKHGDRDEIEVSPSPIKKYKSENISNKKNFKGKQQKNYYFKFLKEFKIFK